MPIRQAVYRYTNIQNEEFTSNQQLIYACESEVRAASKDKIMSFDEWANFVDYLWLEVRDRAEDGPQNCHGRARLIKNPDFHPVDPEEFSYSRFIYAKLPMNMIPVWIEKYPTELSIKWNALWAEPNIIVAGHQPLHEIWAVHEVAHMLVYYQNGVRVNEEDNGHGPIWKRTYLELLEEFLPEQATRLEKVFSSKGIDI